MALHQEKEGNYCKWIHLEPGNNLVRRIHHMKVQAHDGSLHDVRGAQLPDSVVTFAGRDHKGLHMAQILLSPNPGTLAGPTYDPPQAKFWPNWRDVMHVAIGLIGAGLLSFLGNLIDAAF